MDGPLLTQEPRTESRAEQRGTGTHEHRCLSCDTYVSADFARVFGNNDDTIYACLNCTTLAALRDGQAVEPR
jgi:hypothetical protein